MRNFMLLVSATTTSTTTGIRTSTTSTASMTPAAKSKKLEEAREYSEKGMKYLKTTLFQWAPDHLAAAPQFEKSADAYKAAGELTNARLMYVKAAESHYGSGTPYMHIHIHIHTYSYIHICIRTNTFIIYIHTLIHMHTNIRHMYIHTCVNIFLHNTLLNPNANWVGVTSAAALTTMKASQVAKAQGDVRAQSALIQQAAEYWGLNGDLDKYGETIAKAAKEVRIHTYIRSYMHTYIFLYMHTYSHNKRIHAFTYKRTYIYMTIVLLTRLKSS